MSCPPGHHGHTSAEERFQGLCEAGERCTDNTGADLASARLAAGDAGINQWSDAGLDDAPDVDADGGAALIQARYAEMGMLAAADLVHLCRRLQGLSHAASADEASRRRRGGHRTAAKPDGLDNGPVAHIRIGIV